MELIIDTLRSISMGIISPPLTLILISLLFIFYIKNKKLTSMQRIIVGGNINSALELTLSQFVLGTVGGIAGSIILVQLGIRFNYECGIQYLFFISILLMFIKPKYICFSYSAGILGLANILYKLLSSALPDAFGSLSLEIDILYLLMFVGILHVVEGVLVMIDGHRGALPVFSEYEDKIIGGYALKRYWIVPITMLFITLGTRMPNSIEINVDTPYYWSIFNKASLSIAGSLLIMPLYAVLGYSSVTFTKSKREKSLSSGVCILAYGFCVIAAAQISRIGVVGEVLVVIFTPAAHEFMLKIQKKSENNSNLKFVSNDDGLIILDISNDSQMNQYGLQIGDRIISVNGEYINSEKEIYTILKKSLYRVNIRIKKINGQIHDFIHVHDKTKRLGILLVPRKVLKEDITPIQENSFKAILEEISKASNSQKDS